MTSSNKTGSAESKPESRSGKIGPYFKVVEDDLDDKDALWRCIFCKTCKMKFHVTPMEAHLLGCQLPTSKKEQWFAEFVKCRQAGEHTRRGGRTVKEGTDIRKQPLVAAFMKLGWIKEVTQEQATHSSNIDDDDDSSQPMSIGNTPGRSRLIVVKDLKKNAHQGKAAQRGSSSTHHEFGAFLDGMTAEESSKLHRALAQMIFQCGLPLSLVEAEPFKMFLRPLRPSYNLPSRRTPTETYLTQEFCRAEDEVDAVVARSTDICISSDAWTDRRNSPVVNIMGKAPDNPPMLIGGKFTKNARHTGKNLTEEMDCVLLKIPEEKLAGCCTDGAANMLSMWGMLEYKYPNMFFYGCLAHALNNLALSYGSLRLFVEMLGDMKSIIQEVSSKPLMKQEYLLILKQEGLETQLISPAATRFGTNVLAGKRFSQHRDTLSLLAVKRGGEKNDYLLSKRSRDIIRNEGFWQKLLFFLDVVGKIKCLIDLLRRTMQAWWDHRIIHKYFSVGGTRTKDV